MPDCNSSDINNQDVNQFAEITRITNYTSTINVSKFFTRGFKEAYLQICQFVNSIIKFDCLSLLVTSFDTFYHNRKSQDDCAHSLNTVCTELTAKIPQKTFEDKQFMDVSIFAGEYIYRFNSVNILQNPQ
ncbi:hypothetical protein MFLAVUS_010333 [Mucor flavus]|uniref:Uncharacterized protein n=1 Tax=Mucor flavus TaxID=439312 RepID=A0ABP9ZCD5_9FUNG